MYEQPPEDAEGPSLRRFLRNAGYGLLTALTAGLGAAFWVYITLKLNGY